jgi:hypothetical protein
VTLFVWRVYFALSGLRPYRLAVRTPPFHGGGTGSIPVRVAKPPFGPGQSLVNSAKEPRGAIREILLQT